MAFIHALGLARFALLHVRGWAANSPLARARLRADNDRLRAEVALLRREMVLKDRRMARLPAARRPRYRPEDRLAVLTLRAARGWSIARTARRFLVCDATVRLWLRRCEEEGPGALVWTPVPVQRFPDFVTMVVQELRTTLPGVGRRRIADLLARAGLHLSTSTARRMLARPAPREPKKPPPPRPQQVPDPPARSIVARRPGHVWGCDLTAVPLGAGLWVPWLPWALPQRWPFSWWVLVVVDHFSRSIAHVAVFRGRPSGEEVCAALDEAVARATGPPRHMVTDRGVQFRQDYLDWCARHGVRPRFGAVGKQGSIAVVERLNRTIKSEGLRRILLPLGEAALLGELDLFARWYNEHRPHRSLGGATPDEVRRGVTPASSLPGFETRSRAPAGRRIRGRPGAVLALRVDYLERREHLPIVKLERVP